MRRQAPPSSYPASFIPNAPIQPGDSGGALADTAGQVIAINTAASAASGFQFQSGNTHTQAYSIPIARALSIAHRIEAHRSSATVHIGATAFVGVQILPGTKGAGRGPGAMVAGVLAGSPAARAGLAAGDVITSVGGYPVTSPSGLQSALGRYHPGDRVTVGWHDATGVPHTATIVLAKGPAG